MLAGFLAQVDRTVIAEVPADLDVLLPLLAEDKASNPAGYAMCVDLRGRDDQRRGGRRIELSMPASQRDDVGIGHRLGQAIKARLGCGTVIQELAYPTCRRAGRSKARTRRSHGRPPRSSPAISTSSPTTRCTRAWRPRSTTARRRCSTPGKLPIPGSPHPPTFRIYEKQKPGDPELHCDFIFVSDALRSRLRSIMVDTQTQVSDHQPVLLTLA